MVVRLSKALLVLLVGIFALLVGVDNVVDYGTNYAFVDHVMTMDTVHPGTTLKWRAITSPVVHQIAYAAIIAAEIATGVMSVTGALLLFSARATDAAAFRKAKGMATAGLTLGFALWFFGFLTVGGEWFQMWQSPTWNGQEAAFRFVASIGIVLIYLNQEDAELV